MNHQHILEASFIPTFDGLKVDGDVFFCNDNVGYERNQRLSLTVTEAYFQHGKLWVVSVLFGPFFIGSLYDVNPESHLKGLAHALASAFINESRGEHPWFGTLDRFAR